MYKHKKLLFEGFVQNQLPGTIFCNHELSQMDWECVRIALRLHNFSNLAAILLEGSGQPALNAINAVAASSTRIRMISQRYRSGTISTPEGGVVVNGAL